jgi:hypothetical protein
MMQKLKITSEKKRRKTITDGRVSEREGETREKRRMHKNGKFNFPICV